MLFVWVAATLLCYPALSEAQVTGYCYLCNGCVCAQSKNPNGYPDGGDCVCASDGTQACTGIGICVPFTTDPNGATDCPDYLNATCCTKPYQCGGKCEGDKPSKDGGPTRYTVGSVVVAPTTDDNDVERVNLKDYPWLTSDSLVSDLNRVSPELSSIMQHKKLGLMNYVGWSAQSRSRERGTFSTGQSGVHLYYQITRNKREWTFLFVGRGYDPKGPLVKDSLGVATNSPQPTITPPSQSEADTLRVDDVKWKLTHGATEIASGPLK